MRWMTLVVALGVSGATGCAAMSFARDQDPREQLAQGAAALEAQNYVRARELLEPLYYHYWSRPVGQQALLALIAAELDTRNPNRRVETAAELATRLLRIPNLEPWLVPVAESYYLLAIELGATEQRVAVAEAARKDAEARAARGIPTPTSESLSSRYKRMEAARDELRVKSTQLETQVATLERELRDTKQELERIKKTIKP